jgi:glycosyltransferase involved in cell wall biosynthesis
MSLNILHVSPFFEPATQFGGPVTLLRDLIPLLAAKGHRVRVVTTDIGIGDLLPRDRWVERDGCQVWYGRTRAYHRWPPYWFPALARVFRQEIPQADVIHLTIGLTLLNAAVRRRAVKARVPYVYTPHGCLCPTRLRQRRRWSKALFLRLFERRIIRDAAALQALTGHEADDLRRLGGAPERIRVISNGVTVDVPGDTAAGRSFRAEYGVPAGAALVLFLGRLQDVKGIDLLVRALAGALPSAANLCLMLAGPDFGFEGTARRLATSLGIAHAVRFTGALGPERRRAAFAAADLFALTSYSEGLPLAALEAAAAGVPLLITDRCHLPEVAHYAAGWVVPAETEAVTRALATLGTDPAGRRRMGDNARRMAQERFALPFVADELDALYRELAAGGISHRASPDHRPRRCS